MRLVACERMPATNAVDQGDGVYLVDDDADLDVTATVLSALGARTAIPVFTKVGSPLDGMKLIRHLISGMFDHKVDDNGAIVPALTGPAEVEL